MPQEQMSSHHNEEDEPLVGGENTKDIKTPGLDEDVDAILDEIDNVLEDNAEDFVRGFIQKGGQ